MNAVLSKTIKAAILRLGLHILKIPAQPKFVSSVCHAHSNAHKPPKPVAPTIVKLENIFYRNVLVSSIPID